MTKAIHAGGSASRGEKSKDARNNAPKRAHEGAARRENQSVSPEPLYNSDHYRWVVPYASDPRRLATGLRDGGAAAREATAG